MRRSYLVIALPVLAATGLISALAFWVGWTMANTEPDLAELEEREIGARRGLTTALRRRTRSQRTSRKTLGLVMPSVFLWRVRWRRARP